MSDQQPETAATDLETPEVGFGEVADESVEESVAHEREITIADDLANPGPEPYDPEAVAHDDGDPEAEADAPTEGLVGQEPTEQPVPTGDQVVNSITAAVRR